jgi:crotonobetainyl-CoA hydratase
VAILTAAGDKFFCPGWDLKAAAKGEAPDADYGVGAAPHSLSRGN